MTFTAGNLFPSHSCIWWPESCSYRDLNPGLQIERRMTNQLSYPSLAVLKWLPEHMVQRKSSRWNISLNNTLVELSENTYYVRELLPLPYPLRSQSESICVEWFIIDLHLNALYQIAADIETPLTQRWMVDNVGLLYNGWIMQYWANVEQFI